MAEDKLAAELNAAGAALEAFAQGPARDAAETIGAAFEASGERIARAFARAALSGEDSFRGLAKTVLEEIAKMALERVLPQSGAQQGAAANLAVNFNLGAGADAESIRRSQAQIAAQVARAASYGARNL